MREWYDFQQLPRYKALSAAEAEAKFTRRNKTIDYSHLFRKGDDDENEDPEQEKLKLHGAKKYQGWTISEMGERIDSHESSSDDVDSVFWLC